MSVGDITIRVEVEGGTAKTATVLSAVRVNALALITAAAPTTPTFTRAS